VIVIGPGVSPRPAPPSSSAPQHESSSSHRSPPHPTGRSGQRQPA